MFHLKNIYLFIYQWIDLPTEILNLLFKMVKLKKNILSL